MALKSKKLSTKWKAFHWSNYKPVSSYLDENNTTSFRYRIWAKKPRFSRAFPNIAVWTGLEPATPCVTGMYSNQLNYQTSALLRWQRYNRFSFTQAFYYRI